jgi:AraC-like DNA-binding protein|tara:strand:- start:643 stop:1521 length:879 start_codon:yes stop_codon:yes gene_type:complete
MNELIRLSQEEYFKEKDFPLDVSTWTEHGDYPRHVHDFSKIAIITHGSGTADVDGQLIPFRTGDVFVMHGNRPNAYFDTEHLTMTNVLYDTKAIELNRFDPGLHAGYQALFVVAPALKDKEPYNRHLTLTLEQLIQVKAQTDTMEKELLQKEPGYRLTAMGHFMILVSLLSRFFSAADTPNARKYLQLGKVLSHLEEHFMEDVNIDELVKASSMSRRSFFRAFPEVTGKTPQAYLLHLRMKKAVEMLEMTDRNITETAFDCGFQDSNYFSRQFKKIMGTTPSEFQKKYYRAR